MKTTIIKPYLQLLFLILFAIIMTCFWSLDAGAQSLNNSNLYTKNRFSLNPAYAGNRDQIFSAFQASNQVSSVGDAPKYLMFNTHGLVFQNLGLGLNLLRDSRGFFETTLIEVGASYVARFEDDHSITFGLSTGYLRERLDRQAISVNNYVDMNDPILLGDFYDQGQLKIGTGVVYRLKNLEVSASLPRIVRTNNQLNFNFMGYAGYEFFSRDGRWMYKPNVLYRIPDGNDNFFDGNFMAEWNRKFWGQVGYRTNGSVNMAVGVNLDFVGVGYSYGYATGDLSEIMTGRHEVLVTFAFGEKDYSKNREKNGSRFGRNLVERTRVQSAEPEEEDYQQKYITMMERYITMQERMAAQEAEQRAASQAILDQLEAMRSEMSALKMELESVVVEQEVSGLDGEMEPGYYVVISTCQDIECARNEQDRFSKDRNVDTEVAVNNKKGFYYIITHKINEFDSSISTMKDMRTKGFTDAWVLVYK